MVAVSMATKKRTPQKLIFQNSGYIYASINFLKVNVKRNAHIPLKKVNTTDFHHDSLNRLQWEASIDASLF